MPEEIRLFFTSQDDVASALKKYIDTYLDGSIDDAIFTKTITQITKANDTLLFKAETKDFTVRAQNILGKKRINILNRIMGGKS